VRIPVGEFAVRWTEQSGKSGDSTYVFQVDGTVLKGKSPYGKANSMNGKVTIQYFDKTRGSVSITDLTEDSFKAIHTWQDGQNTTWKASRVK